MARARQVQYGVHSAPARAHELARLTRMTATQVVEEALRGFGPGDVDEAFEGLVRRGPILVKPAAKTTISQAHADRALEAVRGVPFTACQA